MHGAQRNGQQFGRAGKRMEQIQEASFVKAPVVVVEAEWQAQEQIAQQQAEHDGGHESTGKQCPVQVLRQRGSLILLR